MLSYVYVHEMKEQSNEWTERGESAPKKAVVILFAGKFINELKFELLPHGTPDLTSLDYITFPNLATEHHWEKCIDLKGNYVDK